MTAARSDLMQTSGGKFAPADRRTVIARAVLAVLQNPTGIETLDWQIADAVLAASQPDREALASAICDGMSRGNIQWVDAGPTLRADCLATADYIIDSLLSGAGTKSDGGVEADTRANETAKALMAHPSPMGSRSCDEKTIACGVAGVAPGPSDPSPGPDVKPAPIADSSEAGTRPCEFCGSTDTADSKSHCEACAHAAPVGEPVSTFAQLCQLGEGIHSALRKASDHEAAYRAWKAIRDLPTREWYNVVQFVIDGLPKSHPPAPAVGPDVREALQEAIDVFEGMNDDEIDVELLPRLRAALTRPLGGFVQEETPLRMQELPGSDRQATEAEADSAIKCLRLAIDAAENSNQAGENAVVKAASAIGWRRA